MHVVWNGMNFFFNSIQSSSQCDIEEYHFCVWWILKENNHFFLIHSNETSHDKRLFSSRLSSYFQPNTISNNNDYIIDDQARHRHRRVARVRQGVDTVGRAVEVIGKCGFIKFYKNRESRLRLPKNWWGCNVATKQFYTILQHKDENTVVPCFV